MLLAKVVRFRAEPSDKLVSYVLQSNWKYPAKDNRIWSDVLVTFSQFEESRENQDSKSVTRTGNDQSCCEFAFSRETDLSQDLYPRQCLLNLRIFTGGTL